MSKFKYVAMENKLLFILPYFKYLFLSVQFMLKKCIKENQFAHGKKQFKLI